MRDRAVRGKPNPRGALALGTLFVIGGLALALTAGNLRAQESAPGRSGELARIEQKLQNLEEELVGLRRRGGSVHDLRRVERLVERERVRLADLREAGALGTASRRGRDGRVPMDGQPITIDLDTAEAPVRLRPRAEPRTTDRPMRGERATDRPTPRPRVRDDMEAEMARLEAEIGDLRAQWERSSGGTTMGAADREHLSDQLEKARDHAEDVLAELEIAERSGMGPRHSHVLRLREELAMAESRVRDLQRRLSGRNSTRRQEIAEQIEQRLARLDRLRARLAGASDRRRRAPEQGRDRLANRVEQLTKAVEEVRGLLQRHRVDEHRVVRALEEVDRRRGDAQLPPPQDPPRGRRHVDDRGRPAVTPALRAQIAELHSRVAAMAKENDQLRQHAEAMRNSLAEHERMRQELERRGRAHGAPAGVRRGGGHGTPMHGQGARGIQALHAENSALRTEADQLRHQLGTLRAEYEKLRRGVYMR